MSAVVRPSKRDHCACYFLTCRRNPEKHRVLRWLGNSSVGLRDCVDWIPTPLTYAFEVLTVGSEYG